MFLINAIYAIKVKGSFPYCKKGQRESCEIIDEIDIIETFDKCTKDPFVTFLSIAGNLMYAFLKTDGSEELYTEKVESTKCSQERIENKFTDFTITRFMNNAFVDQEKNVFPYKMFKKYLNNNLLMLMIFLISITLTLYIFFKYKKFFFDLFENRRSLLNKKKKVSKNTKHQSSKKSFKTSAIGTVSGFEKNKELIQLENELNQEQEKTFRVKEVYLDMQNFQTFNNQKTSTPLRNSLVSS